MVPDPSDTQPVSKLLVRATSCVQASEKGSSSDDAVEARSFDDGTFLAVVADGLGGAEYGGDAARKAVAIYCANYRNRPRAWSPSKALEEITRHLNRQLHQEGLARYESPELSTTVVAVALDGNRLHLINAGDSRCYHWRNATLTQLSEDHRESGADRSHILYKALGLADDLVPHFASADLQAGDVLLLCSDGLSDLLSNADIARLLATHPYAHTLVNEARGRATPETLDDIAVVVLVIESTGQPTGCEAEALPIPDRLKAGDIVDGFTLRQSFRATDRIWLTTRAGESFVLKFAPLEARSNEAILTQFIRETWHATSLRAHFFPTAFVPEGATSRYYALQYFQAPTLHQWIATQGRLDTSETVALGLFLLDAAQFLLRHDFVHGDLKPENILVLGDRGALTFKLIDLGSVAEVFSVNTRAGTSSYLAPERFHGAAVSESTELFAIGVVLYQAVTGQLPFGEIEPFQTPVFRTPRQPSRFNPHLPPWLDAVLLHALAPCPEDRYTAYSEMRFELDNPEKVRPFHRANAPLAERNPILLLKLLLVGSIAINLLLFWKLLSR